MKKDINAKMRSLKAFCDIANKENNNGDYRRMLQEVINKKDCYNHNRLIYEILSYIAKNPINLLRIDIAYETLKACINEEIKKGSEAAKNNHIEIDSI
jgi:aryl-phospho-beta-D-glucosidase BglC (GH1 family)